MENEALQLLEDQGNIQNFGYALLFLYSMGGGYLGIITAGVFSSLGKLHLGLSMLLAMCGNVIGSSLFCLLARSQKKEVAKLVRKQRRKFAYVQLLIKKYDWPLFFISKFLHGFRTFVPLAVGLGGYSIVKFMIINLLAVVVWGIALGLLGFYATGALLPVVRFLLEYPYAVALGFLGILVIVGGVAYVRKRIGRGQSPLEN